MQRQITNIRDLIRACVAGDVRARCQFQEEYGEDIYNFPIKIYRLPAEDAGDFYIYVFEDDRIFTRVKTFTGRNGIQFRTFLSYYVLKHLFSDWRQTRKTIETISLNTPLSDTEDTRVLEDTLPDTLASSPEEDRAAQEDGIWDALSPEERLDLKLLALIECNLNPQEIWLLAKLSDRSVRDTLDLLTEVQTMLRQKDEKLSRLREDLDSVWGWILLRRKELQEIDKKIHLIKETRILSGQDMLLARRTELERTLAKRYRQRERIMEEIRTYKMSTPYKEIARLLNLPVGTVGSRISRLRERLTREYGGGRVQEECVS